MIHSIKNIFFSIILFIISCYHLSCSYFDNKITEEKVIKICTEHLLQVGVDTSKWKTTVYPHHPITLDSIKSGDIFVFRGDSYDEWLKKTNGKLYDKTFWKCWCEWEKMVGAGIYEIFIDAKSGEIIYSIRSDQLWDVK
jgi:hypothetical protein